MYYTSECRNPKILMRKKKKQSELNREEKKIKKEEKKKNTFEIDKAVVEKLQTNYLIDSD